MAALTDPSQGAQATADQAQEAEAQAAPGQAQEAEAQATPGQAQDIAAEAGAYIEGNWDAVVADIASLVAIESTEALDAAAPGAPFGPGPRQALTQALAIAERMGFQTHDVDGYVGYAELPGASGKQLGIIGHVDVVAAGPGWTVEPFELSRREGYLQGRGVIDDKGPIVTALHALKFWRDKYQAAGTTPPHTVRIIFGANEEAGMGDVAYYRQRFADPDFLFTPDAEFPVGYGEKGLYAGLIESPVLQGGVIAAISGGAAPNAVPGVAHAIVRAEAGDLDDAAGIAVDEEGEGLARITATGKSAHASLPHLGTSAIDILVRYLLDQGLCSADERRFLELVGKLTGDTTGAALGIACADDDFGELTVVGGTIESEPAAPESEGAPAAEGDAASPASPQAAAPEGDAASSGPIRIKQTVDCRYPTSTTGDAITAALAAQAEQAGASYRCTRDAVPFIVDPTSPEIQALISAYNEVTGEAAEPFTMGGGTYAREFSRAASFGPEMPWVENPDWAGGMHGPDEAVREEQLQTALKIYAVAIGKLMELAL